MALTYRRALTDHEQRCARALAVEMNAGPSCVPEGNGVRSLLRLMPQIQYQIGVDENDAVKAVCAWSEAYDPPVGALVVLHTDVDTDEEYAECIKQMPIGAVCTLSSPPQRIRDIIDKTLIVTWEQRGGFDVATVEGHRG